MPEDHPRATTNRRTAARHSLPRLCLLIWSNGPAAGRLRDISADGTFIETDARPAIGDVVLLEHPEAGTIQAQVMRLARDGIGLSFASEAQGVHFAMAAIAQELQGRHGHGAHRYGNCPRTGWPAAIAAPARMVGRL